MNLEFFIKLKEMVSGGLVKMASTAKSTSAQVRGANTMLSQSYDEIKRKISDLESVISRSKSVEHIRAAKKELAELQKMQSKHAGSTGGGGSWLGNAFKQALPAMGIAGALALGGTLLNSGMEAQARQVSFEVMAGKQSGTALNQNLTKYAQDSIYGTEVYDVAKTQMGFGISDKKVMGNIGMLGDIAMGDANKLQSLNLAFSQVSAAGKLTGNDLLQFINAGFNPLQEMAAKTGLTIGELKDKMSDGLISFDMVEAAFKSATSEGGRFYQMTKKIGESDYGKMQAFFGQLQGFGMQLGGIIAPMFGALFTVMSGGLTIVSDFIGLLQDNADVLQFIGSILLGGAVAYGAYAAILSAIAIKTALVSGATGVWATIQGVLNAVMNMNPILRIVTLIGALVGAIVYAWNHFEGFRMAIWGLWGAFKQVFENIGGLFQRIFAPIFDAIQAFKDGRFLDAGKAIAKMAYNLTPMGLIQNTVQYAGEGGFTKGVKEAYQKESLRGVNKKTSVSATDAATPGSPGVGDVFKSLGKGGGDADAAAKAATSGGPRVININGVKFAETININAQNFTEGVEQTFDTLEEYFLRLLNSGAALQ